MSEYRQISPEIVVRLVDGRVIVMGPFVASEAREANRMTLKVEWEERVYRRPAESAGR